MIGQSSFCGGVWTYKFKNPWIRQCIVKIQIPLWHLVTVNALNEGENNA